MKPWNGNVVLVLQEATVLAIGTALLLLASWIIV